MHVRMGFRLFPQGVILIRQFGLNDLLTIGLTLYLKPIQSLSEQYKETT